MKAVEAALRKGRRGSNVRAFCCVTALAAWLGVGFEAMGATGQPFSYDFANTGKISFEGTSSGVLLDSRGAPNVFTAGSGTNSFQWGVGYNSPSSSLSFTGKSLDGAFPEQPFSLGTLSYFNGTVLGGTEAYSVGLRTTLGLSGFVQDFDYGFQLLNTPNTADPVQSADSVFLASSIPSSSFAVDGINYTLKLAFGRVSGSGFSEVNRFFVLEGQSASAELIGSITATLPDGTTPPPSVTPGSSTPTVVPEPSTVLGGISAGALILAFLLRRVRRDNSAAVAA